MKHALFVLFNLFALSGALAGPEEHLSYQTCYELQETSAPASIPRQICLEKLVIDLGSPSISVFSYFQPHLFQNLKISDLRRKNEDFTDFKAQSVFSSQWDSGCGGGEILEVRLEGKVDNFGIADVNRLGVAVARLSAVDTCHSQPSTVLYSYLVK